MASSTLVRRVMLQIAADDGDTEAKLDAIGAKADELGKKHPELAVRINTAAASAKVRVLSDELKAAAKPVDVKIEPKVDGSALAKVKASGLESGQAFGSGFSMMGPQVLVPAVAVALASLPAVAATAGAGAGIALGAALLVGTKQAKGPLYAEFHDMTAGLTGVLRQSALPLVKPLSGAFRMIEDEARVLKPELAGVFRAIGPDVVPLTHALLGLVQGPLSGFLSLMKASKPAVTEVSGALRAVGTDVGVFEKDLIPGVTASGKVFGGLLRIVGSLLPVVGTLSSDLSGLLAPIVNDLGTKEVPELVGSVDDFLKGVEPLLPKIGTLADDLLKLSLGPAEDFIGVTTRLADDVLPSVIGPANDVIDVLDRIAKAAEWAFDVLSTIPGLGSLKPHGIADVTGGIASMVGSTAAGALKGGAPTDPSAAWLGGSAGAPAGASGGSSGSTGPTQAQQAAFSKLGSQITAAFASTLIQTIPQLRKDAARLMAEVKAELAAGMITKAEAGKLFQGISNDLERREAQVKADAAKLGRALNGALVDAMAGSKDASAAKTAVGKLIADVKTAYEDGVISLQADNRLTQWLDNESVALQRVAARRAYITSEISKARQLAASTAGNVAGGYGLSNFASSGLNGGPAGANAIIRTLHGDVIQIRHFASNIKKLAREGLDKNYLMQLIAMGPVQGGALAQELAGAALSDINSINKYEYQLTKASGSLGKMAGNIQFEGGKAAADGFAVQLEKQKAALDKRAREMGKAFVAEVRHGLGVDKGGHGGQREIVFKVAPGADKMFITLLKKYIAVHGGDPSVLGR